MPLDEITWRNMESNLGYTYTFMQTSRFFTFPGPRLWWPTQTRPARWNHLIAIKSANPIHTVCHRHSVYEKSQLSENKLRGIVAVENKRAREL